ncbi:flavodoxin [Eubacteriales bacterium OttesenSCG-928-A19]|nr:flavodoxin [Eubacteriales bacterium OttesenSCG-928-A19]
MDKTAIVYWSGTGNTKDMAEAIAKGMKEAGADVDVFEVTEVKAADIAAYPKMALGCPSMGDEVLEEGDFEPFFTELEGSLTGKKVALFGSYGWGDGQWMRDWAERARDDGATLYDDGLIVQEAPDEDECVAYGRGFAGF